MTNAFVASGLASDLQGRLDWRMSFAWRQGKVRVENTPAKNYAFKVKFLNVFSCILGLLYILLKVILFNLKTKGGKHYVKRV